MGQFYPPGSRPSDWLGLYARAFDAVEVDSTFYGPPPADRFIAWRERTPASFLFSVKMPGEVTHEAGLVDPRPALRFCQDARGLGEKLAMILVQLPPGFGPDRRSVTARFLHSLPDDLPIAVEFRDRAWLVPETMAMLEETGSALALSTGPWLDEPAARSLAPDAPGSTLYLRWLGAPVRRDPAAVVVERDRELEAWARCIEALEFRRVLAFFSNDYQGHGPASARRLQSRLGQAPVSPQELSPQRELFG